MIYRKKKVQQKSDIDCVYNRCADLEYVEHVHLPEELDSQYLIVLVESIGHSPVCTARITYKGDLLFTTQFMDTADARMSMAHYLENHYIDESGLQTLR